MPIVKQGVVNITGDTMTGPLRVPAGTVAAPGAAVGEAGTGFFRNAAGDLRATHLGVEGIRLSSLGIGVGVDPNTTNTINVEKIAGSAGVRLIGETNSVATVERVSSDTGQSNYLLRKSRGTIAARSAVLTNDFAGSMVFQGFGATTHKPAGQLRSQILAATPSDTDMEARLQFLVPAAGSAIDAEIARWDHATGMSMFDANPVIDQNRHFRLRSYTIATLPSSAVQGQKIYCSDLGISGAGGDLVSDGLAWRVCSDQGQQNIATDVAFTLTPLANPENIRHTGTLTANRAVTLSNTNAYGGSKFMITRTGGGAFTLDIGTGPLKSLSQNQWCIVTLDSTGVWYLSAFGSL